MFRIGYVSETGSFREFDLGFFKFSGGEIHFKNSERNEFSHVGERGRGLLIITDLCNSEEIMKLMLVADFFAGEDITLSINYLPYARQDRKTSDDEPFSLKTMCRLINSCNFKVVVLNDPHSDVATALINNVVVRSRVELFALNSLGYLFKGGKGCNPILISPDAGAIKKNNDVATYYGIEHVNATKVRNTKTGAITATEVHTNINLEGSDLVIVDDICDGGRTFIELAKVLKTYRPKSISLVITVGIYSNGIDSIKEHIPNIYHIYKLGEPNED